MLPICKRLLIFLNPRTVVLSHVLAEVVLFPVSVHGENRAAPHVCLWQRVRRPRARFYFKQR